jgi:hypothetical protein
VTRVRRSDGRNCVTSATQTPRTQSGKNGSPQCQELMRGHPSSKRTKEKREDPGKVSVSIQRRSQTHRHGRRSRASNVGGFGGCVHEKGNGTAGAASPGVVPLWECLIVLANTTYLTSVSKIADRSISATLQLTSMQ